MKTDYYKDQRYTNEKGYQNYEDSWMAVKVIALVSFLVWFGFLA